MPVVVLLGRSGTTDALLAAHVLAAVSLDLAPPGEAARGRAVLFGALLGMAFLAKGPIGLLLPSVVVLAGRTAAGREVWPGVRAAALAAAAAAAVIVPWALALVERVGWPAVRGVLETELGGRIAEGAGHPAPDPGRPRPADRFSRARTRAPAVDALSRRSRKLNRFHRR